jgi:hypothetical protein
MRVNAQPHISIGAKENRAAGRRWVPVSRQLQMSRISCASLPQYSISDTTDLSHLGVLSRMFSTLIDQRSRLSGIVLNEPPTDYVLIREVLNPALHVLT